MDRRAFLRGGLRPPPKPRLRPPGAVTERAFRDRCTSCDDCANACPHGAIFTLKEDGTPLMIPDRVACHMCVGWPCVTACGTEALVPPTSSVVPLGTARIREDRCLVFRGPECGACAGLCPEDAPALKLVIGRPVVDEEVCVGCGLCSAACPVSPSAVEIV